MSTVTGTPQEAIYALTNDTLILYNNNSNFGMKSAYRIRRHAPANNAAPGLVTHVKTHS